MERKNNGYETVPTFYPTLEEMQDFSHYLFYLNDKYRVGEIGLCKIVPPSEWSWKPKKEDARHLIVRSPITQAVMGRAGIYSMVPVENRDISVSEFEKYADSRPCPVSPIETSEDFENVERHFWKNLNLTSVAPIYGADVPGSLFGDSKVEFNVNTLDCLLKRCGISIPGITSPMMYVGSWRSFFPYHTEDLNMFSINVNHFGAPKFWYGLSPQMGLRFESLAGSQWSDEKRKCSEFLRHKSKMFSPSRLQQAGISFVKGVQRPGEIIVTWPASYHAGFNAGYNCAEAVNFVCPSLAEYYLGFAKKAKICKCRHDSVSINVDWLEEQFKKYTQAQEQVKEPELLEAQQEAQEKEEMEDDVLLARNQIAKTKPGALVLLKPLRKRQTSDGNNSLVEAETFRVIAFSEGFVRLHKVGELKANDIWVNVKSARLSKVV